MPRLTRAFASILTLAALSLGTIAPAFAGAAETAFLKQLSNSWTGQGRLSGAQSGPVTCRIAITGGGQSAKYQGRCSIPDMAARAFNGAIFYNDAKGRYETRSVGGVVPGVKRGNILIFTIKDTNMGGTVYSTMTISPSSLTIDFSLIEDATGDKTTSHISFSK